MASKQRADRQKEKEKKEKIILVVLVAVMVVVGAIELPTMLNKKSPSSSGSPGTTAQPTTTSSGANSSGTPSPGSGTIESLPNASGYTPDPGQLSGFSLFNSRDPFGSVTTSSTTTSPTTTSKTTTTTPQSAYVAARISVNDVSEDVLLNATFPSDSPVFVLDSVSATKIKISVAGGSFSSGQSKVAIAKGKSVVLVNTVDSTRYAIKFITALTAVPTTGSTTTGGATTGSPATGSTTTSNLTVTTS